MHDERDEAGFPFRPWPALAAAVALGTALGPALLAPVLAWMRDAGDVFATGARLACLALVAGAALVASARSSRAAALAASPRPSARARGSRRAWSAWLGLVALAAALRALPLEPGTAQDVGAGPPTGRFAPLSTSIAGARDDERPARRWVEPQGERRVHGRLEPRTAADVRWTTTEGTLAAGERVALLVDPRALRVDAATVAAPSDDDLDDAPERAADGAGGLGATPFSGPARGPVPPVRAPPVRVALAPDEVLRLARAANSPLAWLARRLDALRAAGLERVRRFERPSTRGLAAALLYGERSELGPETADLFVRTGTQHLLAVSGLHVALVAWLVLGPLAALARRIAARAAAGRVTRRSARVTTRPFTGLAIGLAQALVVGAYVPLAGARPPVVRAALCCALAALALCVRRPVGASHDDGRVSTRRAFLRPDALSLWSLALVLECLGDPRAPSELSVQLSYGATLGLIVGYAPFRRALAGLAPGALKIGELDRHGRARGAWWRVPFVRLVELALAGAAVSCVAMLATLPFTWSAFGEVSPWSIVLTPLCVPLVAAFLAVGFALAAWPALAEPALNALARAIIALLDAADRWPLTPFALPARPTALVATASVLTFAALCWTHARGRARASEVGRDAHAADGVSASGTPSATPLGGPSDEVHGERDSERLAARLGRVAPRLAAALWAVVLVPWSAAPRGLELWALDVGGGTAVALRAPGAATWIFDAGSRNRAGVARGALAPLLATWEPAEVAVVLSHGHADHHAALGWLVERHRVRLWAGALPAHLDERLPHGVPRLDLARGALAIDCGPRGPRGLGGLELVLLRGALGGGNEGSRALSLRYLGRRVLLTGDHEAEGLRALIEDGRVEGPLEVLLVPHHGSESELYGPLFAAARPREAWISAGHMPPIARELDRRGLAWRWTARDGPLGLQIAPRPGGRGDGVVLRFGATGALPELSKPPSALPPGTDRAHKERLDPSGPHPPGPLGATALGAPDRRPPAMNAKRALLPLPLASLITCGIAWAFACAIAPAAAANGAGDGRADGGTRRALVQLADGRVLRGSARPSEDGAWEVRGREGWRTLSAGEVARVRDEDEALDELERLRASLGDGADAARRVELASWMLAQGLAAEALVELDRVLDDDPAQPAALALIERGALPIAGPALEGDLDARREALCTFGAQSTPVGRALAVRELARLDDREALRTALNEELVDGSLRRRSFAALALGRLFPEDELRALVARAVLDSSEDVRRAAAKALRAPGEPGVIAPIVRALASTAPSVRANAIQALGDVGYPAAVAPLMAHLAAIAPQTRSAGGVPHQHIFVGKQFSYLQDFDVEVAQNQAVADPQINVLVTGAVLDAGVHSVNEYAFTHERKLTRHALRDLTGVDAGNRSADWIDWWEQNRAAWEDRPVLPSDGRTRTQAERDAALRAGDAR